MEEFGAKLSPNIHNPWLHKGGGYDKLYTGHSGFSKSISSYSRDPSTGAIVYGSYVTPAPGLSDKMYAITLYNIKKCPIYCEKSGIQNTHKL